MGQLKQKRGKLEVRSIFPSSNLRVSHVSFVKLNTIDGMCSFLLKSNIIERIKVGNSNVKIV